MKRNMILAGMSKFRMILLLFAIVIFEEGNALADGTVWLYKPGETEPYNSYVTVKEAVTALNNTVKKDNCIIELHGDVEETGNNLAPSYSVTFRSEKNADHTLKFKLTKESNSGFYFSTASKTIAKGKKMAAGPELYSGAHDLGNYAAKYLAERLQEQRYSKIIIMFDNTTTTTVSYDAYKPDEQIDFYKAANLLAPYYQNDQVIWISSGTYVS